MLTVLSNKIDDNKSEGNIRTFKMTFSDVDRYHSDKYEADISLRENYKGYSMGCLIVHAQIGVATFTKYWHYDKGEIDLAKNDFDKLVKISTQIRDEIEYKLIPPANLGGMFKNRTRSLDLGRKEKSNIPSINYTVPIEYEQDYRRTIYGPRYPEPDIQTYSVLWQGSEKKKIVTEDSGRNKVVKYTYGSLKKRVSNFLER